MHIPYLQDSPQERLFQWYHEGLNAFLNTCPTGNALQHQFGPRLLPLLEGGENKAWDTLVADARSERERLEAELHTGRDRLLELTPAALTKVRRWSRPFSNRTTSSPCRSTWKPCSTPSASTAKTIPRMH